MAGGEALVSSTGTALTWSQLPGRPSIGQSFCFSEMPLVFKILTACSIRVSNSFCFKEENWGWGGSKKRPPAGKMWPSGCRLWSSLAFSWTRGQSRTTLFPPRVEQEEGEQMWRQVLRKSPWGKLGGLPGGGKAEGQEPKEGMRCLLGHGMAVGRWVGETDDPERSTGSVERELGGRAG